MECAQDFAYADEEEADGEIIDMFSSDSIQDPNNSTGSFPFNARPQMAKRQVGKIDTNIVEINLNCLKQDVEVATGEPIFCSNCNSVFNSFSKYTRQDQNVLWNCEFCGNPNLLQLEDEELPNSSELSYVVESNGQAADSKYGTDDSSAIIFCIDISGSMCVTKPVSGQLNLKTNKHVELMKLAGIDEQEQHMPGERRDITYVSRLECVQGAIESQLKEMKLGTPNRKVGLVSFNSEVRVIGDGRSEEIIAGDRLHSHDYLNRTFDGRFAHYMGRGVGETADDLISKVYQLEEGGPTALGPALLTSILLASQGGVGSKVIICTDGLANIGLGSLEPGLEEVAEYFYAELGKFASEKGVIVSLISIEGEECKLELLSTLTEQTNGEILRVQPENISVEFANILSENVIATHVNLSVQIHKALHFRDEDPNDLSFNNSKLNKKIGNATSTSSIMFGFSIKSATELRLENIDKSNLKEVPIQAVISYTSLNGMKCIRTITKIQPLTSDLGKVRKEANFDILTRAGTRQAAKMAMDGRFEDAKRYAQAWRQNLVGQVHNEAEEVAMNQLDIDLLDIEQHISSQISVERHIGIEISHEEEYGRENLKKARRQNYGDSFSSKMRKMVKKKK